MEFDINAAEVKGAQKRFNKRIAGDVNCR